MSSLSYVIAKLIYVLIITDYLILLDEEKSMESELTNDIGRSSTNSSSNISKIKQEEIDTDSDLDANPNFSSTSRNASSWYSCDGQI